mmetsp:Transcript_112408/g.223345  ORF Transcript_112408/g.223345 Transcript_112408/m.223345 type:complete len:245 (+) Transcript_112408:723-1457(+)
MYTLLCCTVMLPTMNSEVWIDPPSVGPTFCCQSCGMSSICLRDVAHEPITMEHICLSKGKFDMSILQALSKLSRRVHNTLTPVLALNSLSVSTNGELAKPNISSMADTWFNITTSGVQMRPGANVNLSWKAFGGAWFLVAVSPEVSKPLGGRRSSAQQRVRSSTKSTVPSISLTSRNFTIWMLTPTLSGPPCFGTGGICCSEGCRSRASSNSSSAACDETVAGSCTASMRAKPLAMIPELPPFP